MTATGTRYENNKDAPWRVLVTPKIQPFFADLYDHQEVDINISRKISDSGALVRWIDEKLDSQPLPSNLRPRLSAGCLDVALEHQKGIVTMVVNHLYGSAFALIRLIFEAYVRGVWLHQCADEQELKNFENNKLDENFGDLLTEIEKLDGFNNGVLSSAKKQSWRSMNSFTHTGFHQVARRHRTDTLEPNYEEEEILEALSFSNAIALLATIEIAHIAGNEALALEVLQKAKSSLPPQSA